MGDIHLDRAPSIAPHDLAMFLDLDGTIAPFEATPSDVRSDARRNAILRTLGHSLSGRLAIISGRRILDVDRIVEAQVRTVAGLHGLEQRSAHGCFQAQPHPDVVRVRDELLKLVPDHPGLIVEMKALSVALHYRARPDLKAALDLIVAELRLDTELVLQAGHMVFEFRTPGPDKGDALRAFMADPPFRDFMPIFVGDDLTDESAFEAAKRLGGFGVLVGEPRTTAARYGLSDVEAVLAWLEAASQEPTARVLAAAHV